MAEENQVGASKPTRKAIANKTLQTNPFTTYRDPKTGQWIVVKSIA